MTEAIRSRNSRIDDIEVLRAFAVGLVLIQHAAGNLAPFIDGQSGPVYGHFGFWSGVDLFFAISGFVIARSLLPQLTCATDAAVFVRSALSFWVRRAWRLLPSAWLWLGITVGLSALFNQSGAFGPVRANVSSAIAAIFYYANFHQACSFGRFPTGAIFHYWSLSLEEQFYLALPFIVFLARGRLATVLAAIAASQFLIKRVGAHGDLLFFHIRSDALSLGVLLAMWTRSTEYRRWDPGRRLSPLARWLLPLGLVAMLSAISGPMFGLPRYTTGLVAILSAGIVWLASYDGDYLFPSGRLKSALLWVGSRSYAIYLIHVPVYFAAREFWFRAHPQVLQPGPGHLMLLAVTSLPLIALCAELNFRWVEQPLRRYGARLADQVERTRLRGGARAAQQVS